jgi:cobalamin biosynthesis Mg chelatase CobN
MKQSTPSGISEVESGATPSENSLSASNADFPDNLSSLADPHATSSESPAPDGSVGYRIAALIAMLLLALATLVIWFYLRGN